MNEEIYIGFESYLNNEMPNEEKIAFESKLKTDIEFSKSFNLYKETTQFLDNKFSYKTADFKQNLQSISKEYFAENQLSKPKVIAFIPWYYAVAASVTMLLGTWFVMQNSNPVYSDYDQHESAYFMERGEENVNLKNAQDFFNAKEYKKAVTAFEKVTDLNNPELQYFYAIALIETNNYQKADTLLKTIHQGTSSYKDKAIWYLALSNLKQEQWDECKKLLGQIPSDAEDYEKAQDLLHDLE
jgi:predicted Zn-dependent protease